MTQVGFVYLLSLKRLRKISNECNRHMLENVVKSVHSHQKSKNMWSFQMTPSNYQYVIIMWAKCLHRETA